MLVSDAILVSCIYKSSFRGAIKSRFIEEADSHLADLLSRVDEDFDWKSFLSELIFCHVVQGFERYLKDALAIMNTYHPNTLNIEASYSIKNLRQFNNIDAAIEHVSRLHRDRVAEKGLRYLLAEFQKNGVELPLAGDNKDKLFRCAAIRNQITHSHTLSFDVEDARQRSLGKRPLLKLILKMFPNIIGVIRFFYTLSGQFDRAIDDRFPWYGEAQEPKTIG